MCCLLFTKFLNNKALHRLNDGFNNKKAFTNAIEQIVNVDLLTLAHAINMTCDISRVPSNWNDTHTLPKKEKLSTSDGSMPAIWQGSFHRRDTPIASLSRVAESKLCEST